MAVNAAPAPRLSACRALVPYVHHARRADALVAAQAHDLVVTPHPLTLQGQTITRAARMRPGESLAGLLARHGVDLRQPGWVVHVGGMEVPAALCSRTRVRPGMLIEAHRVPGKSVIRLVAMIALAYFTMGTGLAAGGIGQWLGLKGFAAYAANVGAFMLGSMVINKVLPPPGQGTYGGAQPGATYSLQGARNGARHFGPLGLLFGQVRVAPDFAALPYSWFEGDDQIQYVQLHAGLNVHTVEALQIGETAIESYSDVTVSRAGFASGNTAMPMWENVDTVAGGLLDAPTAPGAYVERTSSANTIMLAVDVVGQLQYVNSKGSPERFTCNVDIEYKLLSSGAWQPFVGSSATVQLANSTTKPLRRTITRGVPAGQYAVRMRKTTKNETRTQAANVIEWSALKSYQNDSGTAVARQVVGIRIRASGQLNGTLDQVTWMATSTPCPVWNGSAWVTEATSNPGALILQFARGVFAPDGRLLWGYGKPDSQIDIEGLKAFMVHCTAQGYRFDHWFTEQVSRRQVLDAIAAAGLASISRHTGKLGVVYMAAGQPIEAVVNMGNIKRGSFRVDYATRTTAEEIEVASPERTNAWRAASLRVLAPGVTVPRETARISPAGITTQAGRLLAARSLMAQNIYGRKSVTWEMDLEHLTVRRWSVVALSHDLTQWGHGGRLHSFTDTAGTITIELDAEVPAGSTPHVGLRLPGETAYRVFAVVPFSGTAHTLTLATSWPVGVTQPGASADNPAMDTLWVFDFKATPGQRLRITDIAPTPDLSGARITAVPEPDEFWTFMASGAYTAPAGTGSTAPLVASGLQVTQERLALSYDLTADLAVSFAVTGPYDHAQVWGAVGDDPLQLLGQTRTTRFAGWRVLNAGTVHVEVRPFDALGRPGAVVAGTHTVVLDAALRTQGNLLPADELTVGLTATGSYPMLAGRWRSNSPAAPAGASGEMVLDLGPDGQPAALWRVVSGTAGGVQGGLYRDAPDAIDEAVAYRLHTWVRVSGNNSGSLLIAATNTERLTGALETSFGTVARGSLVSGRWYLLAGYVYASTHVSAETFRGGVWDSETGGVVATLRDLRWTDGADACGWKIQQQNTTAAGAVTDWAPMAVHVVDGSEPGITALLAMSARGQVAWLSATSQLFVVDLAGVAVPASITFTAQAQNLSGSPTFSVTSGGILSGTGLTRTLAYSDMAAESVTVTMTWADITDTITVTKVRQGGNAITALLTNESHTVATAADGSGGSYATAGGRFMVYDGSTDMTGTAAVAYSVPSSSGVSISIASTGIYTVTGMSADTATATLRAVYAGLTLDKVYSISRSKAGTPGVDGVDGTDGLDGAPAKALFIGATSQVFQVPAVGAATPASIAFTAAAQNLTGSPTFSVIAGTATLSGSGATRTMSYGSMSSDAVTVQVSQDGLTDTITVVKVREGADGQAGVSAVVGVLTNEAHVVQTAADGSGGSYGTAGGTFLVFDGLTDKTGNAAVTYSVASSSGVSISIASTGVYTVTGTTADTASATLRAVYGGVTINKVYSISRSRSGSPGLDGADGAGLLTLIGSSGVTIDGGNATKISGGTAWNAHAYSLERYSAGAFMSFQAGQTNAPLMGALNTDPTSTVGFDSLDFAWYCNGSGGLEIFQNGFPVSVSGLGSYSTTTVLAITYDGKTVSYLKDGSVVHTVGVAAGLQLAFDSSFFVVGAAIKNIRFGPMGPAGADGAPAISSSLTRQVANFTADSTGLIDGAQSFATTMQVLLGTTDDTSNWTISRTSSDASITTTLAGATVTITGIGTSLDAGTVTVTATRSGYPTQSIVVQVGKNKRAVPTNGPVTSPGLLEASSFSVSPSPATTRFELRANGEIWHYQNGSSSNIGNWYLANSSGIGSGYEARFDMLTGSGLSTGIASNAMGVWASLSAAKYVEIERTTSSSYTYRLYSYTIRRTSDGAQVSAGQVSMECGVDL